MSASRTVDVAHPLRQAILRGDYPFGSRLKINDIARRFGVSHMPVRKALLQLEGERLVRTEPNRGASVRPVDVEFVGNTYDIVIPLEALLARRAAERMGAAARAQLARIETVLEDAAARLDHQRVYELNIVFHRVISDGGANPEAAAIVDRSQELLRAFRRAYGLDDSRLPGVVADHRSLLRAFADRDGECAASIAAAHAARAKSDLIATIRASGPPPPPSGVVAAAPRRA